MPTNTTTQQDWVTTLQMQAKAAKEQKAAEKWAKTHEQDVLAQWVRNGWNNPTTPVLVDTDPEWDAMVANAQKAAKQAREDKAAETWAKGAQADIAAQWARNGWSMGEPVQTMTNFLDELFSAYNGQTAA